MASRRARTMAKRTNPVRTKHTCFDRINAAIKKEIHKDLSLELGTSLKTGVQWVVVHLKKDEGHDPKDQALRHARRIITAPFCPFCGQHMSKFEPAPKEAHV